MKLKCALCDLPTEMREDSPEAKRYRNHPLRIFICPPCSDRVRAKTLERLQRRSIKT